MCAASLPATISLLTPRESPHASSICQGASWGAPARGCAAGGARGSGHRLPGSACHGPCARATPAPCPRALGPSAHALLPWPHAPRPRLCSHSSNFVTAFRAYKRHRIPEGYAQLKHSTQGGYVEPPNKKISAVTGRGCRDHIPAHSPLALGSEQCLLHGLQLVLQVMDALAEPVLASRSLL